MRRTLITAVATLAVLTTAPVALAHTHPKPCIVPKLTGLTLKAARTKLARAHCKVGTLKGPHTGKITAEIPKAGRHTKHNMKVRLTFKAATTPPAAPQVSYTTNVDPTFTQDPGNPLAVTYTYSADATETINGIVTDLAATGQLPPGILNFLAGGVQVCSINVGGTISAGTCFVTYPATGSYQVTTQYIPNAATAVTETDTETISPYATTVDLATAIGTVQGNYFDIGVAWSVEGPTSLAVPNSSTVAPTFTITDQSTGQTIGTWTGHTGITSCYITDWANGTGMYFDGDTCFNGDAGYPDDLSYTDTYVMTVTFPGLPGYSTSISGPQTI